MQGGSLTYIKSMSLEVTASHVAPNQPDVLQTVNSKEDAVVAAAARAADEATRKADDEVMTEVSMSEGEKDKEDCNRKDGDKKVLTKQIKRKDKRAAQAGETEKNVCKCVQRQQQRNSKKMQETTLEGSRYLHEKLPKWEKEKTQNNNLKLILNNRDPCEITNGAAKVKREKGITYHPSRLWLLPLILVMYICCATPPIYIYIYV